MTDLGGAARRDVEHRTRGCARPVRLTGSTITVDRTTGEVTNAYRSADELDGYTWVRCGDRRAARCESCSREYKGDAWHLLSAGMAGGKGVPDTVTQHPAVFATLTAPSFGPVHGRRPRTGACRPRHDRPVCPHGRPLYCYTRHTPDDPRLGDPLCADCYDYTAHVLWQWHAPELWRRFTIALGRTLAQLVGVDRRKWADLARVSYTKVAEFQARGVIHVHAVIRLDGPDGPASTPRAPITADQLGDAITTATRTVRLVVTPDDVTGVMLRWGEQVDVRSITVDAGREDSAGPAHPGMVAAYLSKYLTKSTEDFGLTGRITTPHAARRAGASTHALRIIGTAHYLAYHGPAVLERLRDRYATLGYRGHPITKTRTWSTTFRALRHARRTYQRHRQNPAELQALRELPPDTDPASDNTAIVLRDWTYQGVGYLDLPQAAQAVSTAARTRTRRPQPSGDPTLAAESPSC